MAIEIVDLPIKSGWIFHSYVRLPEGRGFLPAYHKDTLVHETSWSGF